MGNLRQRRACLGLSLTLAGALLWACSSDPKAEDAAGGKGGSSTGGSSSGGKAGSGGEDSGGTAGSGAGGKGGEGGSAASAGAGGTAGAGATAGAGGTESAGSGGQAGGGGEGGVPECTVAADTCPTGNYCTSANECVPGCKNAEACASAMCSASHDCEPCVADAECAEGRHCATGVCSAACSEGDPESCADGLSCCTDRCVDVERDVGHCGACGEACGSSQFCGVSGCTDTTLANVCNVSAVMALLSGQAQDDASANAALAGLDVSCVPAPGTGAVDQTQTDIINQTTGQIVQIGGYLVLFAGGPYWHKGAQFLEAQRITPVYAGSSGSEIALYRTSDNQAIVTSTFQQHPSHDILVIQVARDPVTGTPAILLYGFHENGTRAAVYQFVNVMLPNLAAQTSSYYVYEWTDGNADLLPDAPEFTLVEAGP